MSVFKEVYIPDEGDAQLEALLKEKHGFYIGKGPTPERLSEELFVAWERESAPARGLVTQMLQTDPAKSAIINEGVISLVGVGVVTAEASNFDPIKPAINWPEVRFGLWDIFNAELPEQPPEKYTVQKTKDGYRLASSYGSRMKGLSPKRIAELLLRYGLTGETPLSFDAIGRRVGRNGEIVAKDIVVALRALNRNITFRRL